MYKTPCLLSLILSIRIQSRNTMILSDSTILERKRNLRWSKPSVEPARPVYSQASIIASNALTSRRRPSKEPSCNESSDGHDQASHHGCWQKSRCRRHSQGSWSWGVFMALMCQSHSNAGDGHSYYQNLGES